MVASDDLRQRSSHWPAKPFQENVIEAGGWVFPLRWACYSELVWNTLEGPEKPRLRHEFERPLRWHIPVDGVGIEVATNRHGSALDARFFSREPEVFKDLLGGIFPLRSVPLRIPEIRFEM